MYFSCWKTHRDCSKVLIILGIVGWGSGIIWSGLFFGIYYKHLKLEYLPAQNCTIQSVNTTSMDGNEIYSSLQIQFQAENNPGAYLIGQGCSSSYKTVSITKSPYPYEFYNYGEDLKCGPNQGVGNEILFFQSEYYNPVDGEDGEDGESSNENNSQRRILKAASAGKGGGGGTGGTSGGSKGSSGNSKSGSTGKGTSTKTSQQTKKNQNFSGIEARDCKYKYLHSEKKIAAWNCIPDNQFENMMLEAQKKPIFYDKCQYTVHGKSSQAWNTSAIVQDTPNNNKNNNNKIQNYEDFYMVIFEEDIPYYDQASFIIFIAFFMVPFLLFPNQCWLVYVANRFEPYFIGFMKDLFQLSFNKKESQIKRQNNMGQKSLKSLYSYKSASQFVDIDQNTTNNNNVNSNNKLNLDTKREKQKSTNTNTVSNSESNQKQKDIEKEQKIAHFLVNSAKSKSDEETPSGKEQSNEVKEKCKTQHVSFQKYYQQDNELKSLPYIQKNQ